MATDNENIEVDSEAHDEGFEFNPRALVQGVRDFLLRNVRENGMKKPWQKMTEGEQRLEIERAEEKADDLVRAIVDIVAQGNYSVVHAIIDNFKIKDGAVTITAKGIAEDNVVLTLNHAGEKSVKLIVADMQQFDQTRSNVPVDPDEPGLPGVKQEIQPEELRGGAFDDAEQDQVDEPAPFNDDAEQAEGAEILEPKSDQWRGGYNSRMAGHWREENPFNADPSQTDWFNGWDEADETGNGRDLNEKPIGKVDSESADTINAEGEVQNGEVNADAETVAADDANTNGDGEAGGDTAGAADAPLADGPAGLTTEERADLEAEGVKARKDGKGPGKNPYGKGSDAGIAWLAGYNRQKQSEQAGSSDSDAAFDD